MVTCPFWNRDDTPTFELYRELRDNVLAQRSESSRLLTRKKGTPVNMLIQ
jgi:hypothetical protein